MKRFVLTVAGSWMLLAVAASQSAAAQFGGIQELTVYPFVQYFTWKEFDDAGKRLLKESGPQFGAGGAIKLALLQGDVGAMTLKGKLEVFGGQVDYDGQYQDGTPAKTDVDYIGLKQELTVGWAIPLRQVSIEPFAGLGYRWWLRDIKGSGGYTEHWSTLYLLLGARSKYKISADSDFFIMGGAKYAFENENSIYDFPGVGDVRLEPGNDWAAVAEGGIKYKHITASIYYENFIFPASPGVLKSDSLSHSNVIISQPRSESEIIGIKVGWAFK